MVFHLQSVLYAKLGEVQQNRNFGASKQEHFCPECLSFHSSLPNIDKHKTYCTEDLQMTRAY